MDEESDLLLQNEDEEKSKNPIKAILPQALKEYWRVFLLAISLLVAGLTFLIIAIYIVSLPNEVQGPHSYVFFIVAGICIIPGGYHLVYMFFASRGVSGYKLANLPTFNEQ